MIRVALWLRYTMLVGSAAALLGAFLMFAEAALKLGAGLRAFAAPAADGAKPSLMASVVGATDASLFGIVLMVFAYSIAFGFVFDLDDETRARLPAWMRIESIHELKQTLVQVILVYLIVDFATDVAEADRHLTWDALILPGAILLVAGAVRLMSEGHRPGER